ncbi:MAG TPA: phosphoglycerate kinase, partial [Nitrospirae bacterium]|nr:phosphoglycerate kinase [Nitrospirota bacterium]
MSNNLSAPIKGVLNKLSLRDLDIKGKKLFIRADFNVPLDDDLNVTDDSRIRSTLPTINYAVDEGARIILASHLGRPKGKVEKRYSLASVAKRLQRLVKKKVTFLPDCVGPEVE